MAGNKTRSNGSLDANALLDWLLYRDERRVDGVQRLINEPGELNISDITILEIAYVLEKVYRQPRSLVTDNIGRIIEDSGFNCNRTLFRLVLPLYLKRSSLSFADCCAVYCARLTNASPLHTFDKKLATQSDGLAQLVDL